MLTYILFGAVIGAGIGHLIPPGGLFWFVIGGLCGFFIKQYYSRRY
ncbi:hypothetical protein SDC9_30316 [bioreactor metagenome]|uniref:Uncharacterized protein n=1 Tax=bioreactor metagenome TaxID=1076179 RepID=A0A644UZI7_9ZZZZ